MTKPKNGIKIPYAPRVPQDYLSSLSPRSLARVWTDPGKLFPLNGVSRYRIPYAGAKSLTKINATQENKKNISPVNTTSRQASPGLYDKTPQFYDSEGLTPISLKDILNGLKYITPGDEKFIGPKFIEEPLRLAVNPTRIIPIPAKVNAHDIFRRSGLRLLGRVGDVIGEISPPVYTRSDLPVKAATYLDSVVNAQSKARGINRELIPEGDTIKYSLPGGAYIDAYGRTDRTSTREFTDKLFSTVGILENTIGGATVNETRDRTFLTDIYDFDPRVRPGYFSGGKYNFVRTLSTDFGSRENVPGYKGHSDASKIKWDVGIRRK